MKRPTFLGKRPSALLTASPYTHHGVVPRQHPEAEQIFFDSQRRLSAVQGVYRHSIGFTSLGARYDTPHGIGLT